MEWGIQELTNYELPSQETAYGYVSVRTVARLTNGATHDNF